MFIDISTIPLGGLDLEFEREAAVFDLENSGGEFLTGIHVSLRLILSGRTVFIAGLAEGQVKLQCVRCLGAVSHGMRQAIQVHLDPEGSVGETRDEGHELHRSELDRQFYSDDTLDLTELLREQVLLGLPHYPLCSEECRGLCLRCGQDLNRKKCGCEPEGLDRPLTPFQRNLKNITLK